MDRLGVKKMDFKSCSRRTSSQLSTLTEKKSWQRFESIIVEIYKRFSEALEDEDCYEMFRFCRIFHATIIEHFKTEKREFMDRVKPLMNKLETIGRVGYLKGAYDLWRHRPIELNEHLISLYTDTVEEILRTIRTCMFRITQEMDAYF